MVPAFALMVAAACSGDAFTDVQGDLERLLAEPSQLFLEIGESKSVIVEGVDASGGAITATYEVTDPGTGFDVRRDSTFLPVYVDDSTLQVPPAAERFRFVVTGQAYGASAFTVTAGDQSITIPVQVVPQNTLEAGISNQTPALGETVTITAPAGTQFTPASRARLPDTTAFAQPFTVSVAADGSTMDVILPPNLSNSRLNITNVTTSGASTVTFSPTTAFGVTTTEVPALTGTTSNLTPAVNEPVTITLAAGQTFIPDADVIAGAVAPAVPSVTATTITFIPAPGTTALPLINGVVLPEVPNIPLSISAPLTDTIVVSPDVPTLPGTDDPGTSPSLVNPALDRSSIIYDSPDFPANIDRWYQVTLTEEGLYTFTLDWTVGSDLDMVVCNSDLSECNVDGATANHPEIAEIPLTAGTYFILAEDFGEDAIGSQISVRIDHAAPEAAARAVKSKSGPLAEVRRVRR
ncbi:MAG TPA: hypothetical protein VEB59_13465 [Gemmatimonadales bacterium]|nr:hypothetical protein [Gemmatimonadales bacterium]